MHLYNFGPKSPNVRQLQKAVSHNWHGLSNSMLYASYSYLAIRFNPSTKYTLKCSRTRRVILLMYMFVALSLCDEFHVRQTNWKQIWFRFRWQLYKQYALRISGSGTPKATLRETSFGLLDRFQADTSLATNNVLLNRSVVDFLDLYQQASL